MGCLLAQSSLPHPYLPATWHADRYLEIMP